MQTLGVSVKQLRRKLLELGARILHVQGSKPRDMALVVCLPSFSFSRSSLFPFFFFFFYFFSAGSLSCSAYRGDAIFFLFVTGTLSFVGRERGSKYELGDV